MSLRLFLRMALREARGSRLRLAWLAACIALGVAAVVGAGALTEAVNEGIRAKSRELLGGDISLESRRSLPDVRALLAARAPDRTRQFAQVSILTTMIRNEAGESRVAEVKAFDAFGGAFPLAGKFELEPAQLPSALDDETVLLAPELMSALELRNGARVYVGAKAFRVGGSVLKEPDPITFSVSLGPRVLMTRRALEGTGLTSFGSRVVHRWLIGLPGATDAELTQIKQTLLREIPGAGTFVNVETRSEAQPALRRSVERARSYLGLVALLSLLVASVGVAQSVSAWLYEALPQIATLRCLGLNAREVAGLYLGYLTLTACVGSLIGSALGSATPWLLELARPELLPLDLGLPWASIVSGIALGVGVALLFAMPSLTSIWEVSPARVLRSEAAPLPVPRRVRVLAQLAATIGLLGAAWLEARDLKLALGFAAIVGGLALALWLGTRALIWLVQRLPRQRLAPALWHGAAAVARPGPGARQGVLSLGLGCLVVVSIALVEDLLGREIHTALPPEAPSLFLVDIQPDQWPALAALAQRADASHVDSVPVVMARLASLDGRGVAALLAERRSAAEEKTREHWILTREQRISWADALPRDNEIIAGSLWSDPDMPEVSLEESFARDLGARVGSVLEFDIQGVISTFKVTSLRRVVWRSFAMNFFVVAEPGTLDDAPQIRLGGVRLPASRERWLQNEIARDYPNVSVLRVQDLLERARSLLAQLALAVRLLGGFSVVTGLLVLSGAVAASQLRRARETALLKTLGLTRARVVGLFAVEYGLVGVVAGVLGAGGAYLLATQFARAVLDLASWPSWTTALGGLLAVTALSVLAGLAASARALRVAPLEVLRDQG